MSARSGKASLMARPRLLTIPGRMVVKLNLGEAPASVPTASDVRLGLAQAANLVDRGPVDRLVQHFSDRCRVTRVHTAARGIGIPGKGHEGFDDLEQALGLARTFRLELDPGSQLKSIADGLRQLSIVESASPEYMITLPLADPAPAAAEAIHPDSPGGWDVRSSIRAIEAMASEPGDPAVIASVIDTGIHATHPELLGKVRPGWDSVQLGAQLMAEGVEVVGDRDLPDATPDDEVGHGTSCASIMAGLGKRIPPGLAGDCSLLPVRVLGSAKFRGDEHVIGVGALSDIDAGCKAAIDLGARVLNMSFGTPEMEIAADDPQPHEDVVRYGLARGCVMVAAAGNSGETERYLPAALDGVIAVGSVGLEGRPSKFTTRGDHVVISAPGEGVLSAGLDGRYTRATGTSFAAPFVTATAALLVSHALRHSRPLDSDAVADLLMSSARPWGAGFGEGCGAGILDAFGALQELERRMTGETAEGLAHHASNGETVEVET